METLKLLLERFGKVGAPRDLIVVWTDDEGKVHLQSNCDGTRSLGLVTWAKADIEHTLVTSKASKDLLSTPVQ